MELVLEPMDDMETPLSDEFWTGFIGGAGLVIGIAAFAVT